MHAREIEQCHFGVYFSSFVGLRRAETAIAQAYFYFSHELSAATAAPFILIVVARRQGRKTAWYYLRMLLRISRALHIDAHGRANKCTFVKKKIVPFREAVTANCERAEVPGARLRDPRYSIRIVNGDNAQ